MADNALSQSLGRPALLSLSRTIEADKKAYYKALESAQRSNEATAWIRYFVGAVLAAQSDAERRIDFVLRQAKFFDRYKDQLADRQLRVLRRMLDEGPDGFEGGLNARKYISIAGVSKSTATRDLQHLVEQGVLAPIDAGRSARYALAL